MKTYHVYAFTGEYPYEEYSSYVHLTDEDAARLRQYFTDQQIEEWHVDEETLPAGYDAVLSDVQDTIGDDDA